MTSSTNKLREQKMRRDIIDKEWVGCLERVRDAKALILRDAEAFHDAAIELEHIGQVLSGEVRVGLDKYKEELLDLCTTGDHYDRDNVRQLFEVVRDARNSAVHDGAWTRHLGTRLTELFLILEEAIMGRLIYVRDMMVQSPVVAEEWHMVSHVRKIMLTNSFSYLPIYHGKKWNIIADIDLMRYLRAAENRDDRLKRLATPIGRLINDKGVRVTKANCVRGDKKLEEMLTTMKDKPTLITDNGRHSPRLLGLIMPFDVL